MAKSDAERQKKRRDKLRAESQKPLFVRGVGGEFDERIRVALAIKELAMEGEISSDLIKLIAKKSETVFQTDQVSTRKFINKIVLQYLTND